MITGDFTLAYALSNLLMIHRCHRFQMPSPAQITARAGLLALFLPSPFSETVIVNLEEPNADGIYAGIANLRGWAIAESGIAAVEIDVDGSYAFNVPMGGARGDVANAYPDFPDADKSGFSMAYNYKGLAPGEYMFTARAISNNGGIATHSATFNVDRFLSSYIGDPSKSIRRRCQRCHSPTPLLR